MDIATTLAPKSDQMDYEDLIAGPLTLTITEVRKGPSTEQPVEVHFSEFPRPWRPNKTMRRVVVHAWGSDTTLYPGRRITLYGDPTVKWGGAEVGGIRLSHLSHIDEPVTIALTVTRGKRAPFVVQPLDTTDRDWIAEVRKATTWKTANRLIAAAVAAKTDEDTLVAMREYRDELPHTQAVES